MLRKYILFSLFIIRVCLLLAQNDDTSKKYIKDFDYLCKKLENTHPNIYYNMSPKEYNEWRNYMRNEISKSSSDTDFILYTSEFLAKFGDSHTKMWGVQNAILFPIFIELYNNKFYITAAEGKGLSGHAITHINQIPIDSVVQILGKYVSAETELCKKFILTDYMRSPMFIRLLNSNIPDSVMIVKMDNADIFSVTPCQNCRLKSDSIYYYAVYKNCQRDFWYKLDTNNSICHFHFNAFKDLASKLEGQGKKHISEKRLLKMSKDDPLFSRFLTEMFQDIQNHNIENFVIDLRHNTGGNSLLGDQLLRFLTNEEAIARFNTLCSTYRFPKNGVDSAKIGINHPFSSDDTFHINTHNKASKSIFNRSKNIWNIGKIIPFKGRIYVLVGNNTYSSAADLAFILSKLGATIVGDLLPQVINCFGDFVSFTTPYSHLQFGISCQYFYDKASTFKDNVLYPTVYIPYDYMDIREGHDKPYEWVLEDIKKNNKITKK